MASRRRRTGPSQTYREDSTWDSSRFAIETAWHRYQDNVHLWNILPKRNVELAPGMYDEFYGMLHRRYWHKRLTRLPEKQIDVALAKEFYSNVYDPEDGSPKTCMLRGRTIQFDTQMLNEFLGTPVILVEGEQLPTYSQYLHSYPDYKANRGQVLHTKRAILAECRGSVVEDSAEGPHHLGTDLECAFIHQPLTDLSYIRH